MRSTIACSAGRLRFHSQGGDGVLSKRAPALWAALQLQRCITSAAAWPDRRAESAYESLLYQSAVLERTLSLSRRVSGHGWHTAARVMRTRVAGSLRSLQSALTEASSHAQAVNPPPIPNLRE